MAALAALTEDRRRTFEALKASLSACGQLPSLPVEALVPSAIPELDQLLGGGLPSGIVATLEGTTGRWSLAAGLVARMTPRSLVAILDDGSLYPPALAEAGASLDRVLVVPARKALAVVRAVDILLRSRICKLVLMPALALRDAVWTRLAKLAHRSGALLIVMAARAGASLSAVPACACIARSSGSSCTARTDSGGASRASSFPSACASTNIWLPDARPTCE